MRTLENSDLKKVFLIHKSYSNKRQIIQYPKKAETLCDKQTSLQ